MASMQENFREFGGQRKASVSNVKSLAKYERFGETIRYLTWEEWNRFLDSIDHYEHKLMMRIIYELGCRVGEFARIQLQDVDLARERVFFPRDHTKTGRRRVSHIPEGLVNELWSWLKQSHRISVRKGIYRKPEEYLFSPKRSFRFHYSENRIRQIFRRYADKSGLNRIYGLDKEGRSLHELTVHSLRHAHIMHYVHIHKLPIAIVQKQVGHTSLKTTSVYLNPSEEAVAEAYRSINGKVMVQYHNS